VSAEKQRSKRLSQKVAGFTWIIERINVMNRYEEWRFKRMKFNANVILAVEIVLFVICFLAIVAMQFVK
jgi:hypothetical protein